eukprot:GHVN01086789.1.p1 GENE.GHVN01086789.1~~GHVN01086789.1.p1  ORF type:complete len:177 (+),score=54.90 GHVN01086789.1:200-730(+)
MSWVKQSPALVRTLEGQSSMRLRRFIFSSSQKRFDVTGGDRSKPQPLQTHNSLNSSPLHPSLIATNLHASLNPPHFPTDAPTSLNQPHIIPPLDATHVHTSLHPPSTQAAEPPAESQPNFVDTSTHSPHSPSSPNPSTPPAYRDAASFLADPPISPIRAAVSKALLFGINITHLKH